MLRGYSWLSGQYGMVVLEPGQLHARCSAHCIIILVSAEGILMALHSKITSGAAGLVAQQKGACLA